MLRHIYVATLKRSSPSIVLEAHSCRDPAAKEKFGPVSGSTPHAVPVGMHNLELLLFRHAVSKIHALGRRSLGIPVPSRPCQEQSCFGIDRSSLRRSSTPLGRRINLLPGLLGLAECAFMHVMTALMCSAQWLRIICARLLAMMSTLTQKHNPSGRTPCGSRQKSEVRSLCEIVSLVGTLFF